MLASSGALPRFADLVRAADRPRYYSALFAPRSARPDLLAVAALRCELAAVADRVSEPGLGEIRLQWWRDAIEAIGGGGPGETPLTAAVGTALARHGLPTAPLVAMTDAFRRDLFSDPPPSTGDLDGFFGETESAVFQLSALMLGAEPGETSRPAGHAGIAYGLARRLAGTARDRQRGRVIIPADLLQSRGLSPQRFLEGADAAACVAAIADAAAYARTHYQAARASLGSVGGRARARAPFLPLVAVPPLLAAVERAGTAILHRAVGGSDAALLLRMVRAALL